MRLIAKFIKISHAKFHCNRLTAVQDIQDYASLIFLGGHSIVTYVRLGGQRLDALISLPVCQHDHSESC